MAILDQKLNPEGETLVALISERARNLYATRQLLCAEAVMMALNQGLNGGLSETQVVSLAAPFSAALGESGCLCGALSGAVMASGLLLGQSHPDRKRKALRDIGRELHDAFKAGNGATCCRVLCKRIDKKTQFGQCAELTADAAALAARLIVHRRPELITHANSATLGKRQSKMNGLFWRLIHYLAR